MRDKNEKKTDEEPSGLLVLGCLALFIVVLLLSWWLWKWVLPIFSVLILVYVCYLATSLNTTRNKVLVIGGTVIEIGVLCTYVYVWNWLMPILIVIFGASYLYIIEPLEKKRKEAKAAAEAAAEEEARRAKWEQEEEAWRLKKKQEEEARRAKKKQEEEARRAKWDQKKSEWREWKKEKDRFIGSWFASADVILDTNIWMEMEPKETCQEWMPMPRKGESFSDSWCAKVSASPGSTLLKILSSLDCCDAKVVVPGVQLDELVNITHKNPYNSPSWSAAQEAINKIRGLQKMGRVYMPDVKARPDRLAYLDAMLVDFVSKLKQDPNASRPVKIVTFDRELSIRLRAVAAGCEHGAIEIIDKDDLIHLLTASSSKEILK